MMSAPRHPFASKLPGIAGLKPTIDQAAGTAAFTDNQGQPRTARFEFGSDMSSVWLTVVVDDQSMCTFKPCPPPHATLWFASGLAVMTGRVGIASHIYALVRDLLTPFDAAITPSGNLFPAGVALWDKLDPSVQFEEQPGLPGYFRPL